MKLLTLLLILLSPAALAQSKLSGTVTDTSGTPAPFILVTAQKHDTTHEVVAEVLTDTAGAFTLQIPTPGAYVVHTIGDGISDVRQTVIINQTDLILKLSVIPAKNTLKGVTVTAQIPPIIRKSDRLVMNVGDNPLTSGKSALEAIALAPGVFEKDDNIIINGNTGARVMVNGKLLQLSGADLTHYLTSLRAEDIKSIEVIAHPPAEFDAAGTGGLINIILRKQTRAGWNGNIWGKYMQGKYAGTTDGANVNFKKGRLGLFANYAYADQKSFDYLDQDRTFPNNGLYKARNRSINRDHSNSLHAGAAYDISQRQYIALDYSGSWAYGNEEWDALTQISYPANPGGNATTRGFFPISYGSRYNDIGLNYHLSTDTLGSGFIFLADYISNNNTHTNAAQSRYYNNESVFLNDTAFRNSTPADATIFTADAKYTQLFHRGATLSFGAKLSVTGIHNVAHFDYLEGDSWLSNEAANFVYDYREQITAGFVNYTATVLKTNIQIGLRGEHTSYTGRLYEQSGNTLNARHYLDLFPSIYLKRDLNKRKDQSIALSYNRRLSRPDFYALNPHVSYVDNYTSAMGNPYLTPQYVNMIQADYTLKNQYTFSASYAHTRDIINNAIRPDASNPELIIQQPINSGSTEIYMISAYVPINVTKWWTMQNSIQLSNQHVTAPQYNLRRNIAMVQTSQAITLPYQFKLTANAYYFSNFLFANAVINPLFSASVGIQKKLLKDRLTLTAGMDDVFNTNVTKGIFYYNDFHLRFTQRHQDRRCSFGVVYNFDLGRAFRIRQMESSNEEEKNRLQK